MKLLIPTLGLLLLSLAAQADEVTTCERDGAPRTITVEAPSAEPGFVCRVLYQKEGSTTVPWSARNDAEFCGLMASNFVEKHKGWGFTCTAGAKVSASAPEHWTTPRIDSVVGEFLRRDGECGLNNEVLVDALPGLGEVAVTTHSCLVDGRQQSKLVVLIEGREKPVLVPVGVYDNSVRPVAFRHGVIHLDAETDGLGGLSASENMRPKQSYAVNEDGSVTRMAEPAN